MGILEENISIYINIPLYKSLILEIYKTKIVMRFIVIANKLL